MLLLPLWFDNVSADLSPGRITDLEVLRLHGAVVTDEGDHLVVRTPSNPDFHWGNFVQVTTGDPAAAAHWVSVFRRHFPDAAHVALGLPSSPDPKPYVDQGLSLSVDDVLVADTLPALRPLTPGYQVRPLRGTDWDQQVRAELADNARTGEFDPAEHERFLTHQVRDRQRLIADGRAEFFGAFFGADLVADLGIVVLGERARYQAVGTRREHRRRGLAGHLLGVASRWAGEHGATQWVIVTGRTNPAGRLYRSLGFRPGASIIDAYGHRPAS